MEQGTVIPTVIGIDWHKRVLQLSAKAARVTPTVSSRAQYLT